jgi:hypothetical protein
MILLDSPFYLPIGSFFLFAGADFVRLSLYLPICSFSLFADDDFVKLSLLTTCL